MSVFSKKVAVFNQPAFFNYRVIREKLDKLFANTRADVLLLNTGERGTALVDAYATQRGFASQERLPDWKQHGKTAGWKRNEKMIDEAEAIIIFGKNHKVIPAVRRSGKPFRIINTEA